MQDENTIFTPNFTQTQQLWMKDILNKAIVEQRGFARNMHLSALGAHTQEEAVSFERVADEARDFANQLQKMLDTFCDEV